MSKKRLRVFVTTLILSSFAVNLIARDAPAPLDGDGVQHVKENTSTSSGDMTALPPPTITDGSMSEAGSADQSNQVAVTQESISNMYPLDRTPGLKTKTPILEQDAFEMDIQKDVLETSLKQQRRYVRMLGGIQNATFLQKPITKAFSAVDSIRVTTEYLTTLVFPKGYSIQYSESTATMAVNKFDQNILFFQPKRDFQSGSFVIGLSNGKKNVAINILVEKYLPGDIIKDQVEGRYMTCGEYISTMIRYVEPKKIPQFEVIKRYLALFGTGSIKNFKKNGSFDVITIESTPFYIIRDDKHGTVSYKNISFRVSDRYEQFAEELTGRRR